MRFERVSDRRNVRVGFSRAGVSIRLPCTRPAREVIVLLRCDGAQIEARYNLKGPCYIILSDIVPIKSLHRQCGPNKAGITLWLQQYGGQEQCSCSCRRVCRVSTRHRSHTNPAPAPTLKRRGVFIPSFSFVSARPSAVCTRYVALTHTHTHTGWTWAPTSYAAAWLRTTLTTTISLLSLNPQGLPWCPLSVLTS